MMFVIDSDGEADANGDQIHQYSLSTGFDLSSTVAHLGSIDLTADYRGIITGSNFGELKYMEFNSDGSKLYTTWSRWEGDIVGGKKGIARQAILQYSLDCPYGIVDCKPTLSSCSPADGATGVGINLSLIHI